MDVTNMEHMVMQDEPDDAECLDDTANVLSWAQAQARAHGGYAAQATLRRENIIGGGHGSQHTSSSDVSACTCVCVCVCVGGGNGRF